MITIYFENKCNYVNVKLISLLKKLKEWSLLLTLYEWNNMCIQHRKSSDFLYLVTWIFVKGFGRRKS